MEEKKLTTFQLLRNKFPATECVLIQEVSDASGFSRSRSLDYMVINLWESRGLSVTGIEKKSNRGDWLKELKNPEKQERHFKYCDYFYLLTDKEGVAKIEEIPPTWGWYHCKGASIKTMKAAPKLESLPIGRSLMCAMLRRAASKDGWIHRDDIEDRIKAEAEKVKQERIWATDHKAKSYDELKKIVDEFEEGSGIKISNRWDWPHRATPKKIGETVKSLMNGGIREYYERLVRVKESAGHILSGIEKQMNSFPVELIEPNLEEPLFSKPGND